MSLARADSRLFVGTGEFDWRGEDDLSPLPSPLMGPGAGLWDPDLPEVSIDTLSPQDARCAADVLSLPSILAHRKREADIRLATTLHESFRETFIARPSVLRKPEAAAAWAPVEGGPAYPVFPPESPRTVASEVQTVEHMLTVANHWLASVDVSTVSPAVQERLSLLAGQSFETVLQRFPEARQLAAGAAALTHSLPLLPRRRSPLSRRLRMTLSLSSWASPLGPMSEPRHLLPWLLHLLPLLRLRREHQSVLSVSHLTSHALTWNVTTFGWPQAMDLPSLSRLWLLQCQHRRPSLCLWGERSRYQVLAN